MNLKSSIKVVLDSATSQLKTEEANLEARLLLQHALNVNRAWLIAHENDDLQPNIHADYRALLQRRLNGEPIAYVLGYHEFYGLKLKVSADTLIPRADTETLVEAALAKIDLLLSPSPQPSPTGGEGAKTGQDLADSSTSPLAYSHLSTTDLNSPHESPRPLWERARERGTTNIKMDPYLRRNAELRVLDLGTGTGAIALAIAKHRPQAHITALDASQAALDIAIENTQNLEITNVKLILSNWFSAIQNEKFDVIISNPPYIEAADTHLKQGDLRFEPVSALASGTDGLNAIRTIITQAPQHLNPDGYLMLEHGYNQADAVKKLLLQHQFKEISTIKDFGGNDRVTIGRLAN